jgi:putative ABC transport system substrate-binding protein
MAPLLVVQARTFGDQKGRVWKVGVLASREKPGSLATDYLGEISRGLAELGYVEGKTLVIEWRFAGSRYERLDELAADLVRTRVDVIVTDGTPSTLAALRATKTVAIVFGGAGDPLGSGIAKSLTKPGGNATGLSLLGEDTSRKQLEILSSLVPKLAPVAILCNPGNPLAAPILGSLQEAGRAMKLDILPVEARTQEAIVGAFSWMSKEKAGAVVVVMDPFYIQQGRQIAELATMNRLPSMASAREFAEAGGLISYGQSRAYNYRRAAVFVDRILKGARPADLPVEQSMKFEMVVNKRTARVLGLEVPAELILLADKVIE